VILRGEQVGRRARVMKTACYEEVEKKSNHIDMKVYKLLSRVLYVRDEILYVYVH